MGKTTSPEVEKALQQFEATALNFSYQSIKMASVRSYYIEMTREYSNAIREAHKSGIMSEKAAAQAAYDMRNQVLEQARAKDAALGRAFAKQIKSKLPGFDKILDKAAQALYKKAFSALSAQEQTAAYLEVVASSGRPQASATTKAARAGTAGRVLFVLGIGVAAYNIAQSDHKIWQTGREAANIGGGIAGGAAAGALAGVWGGPIGVAIGAFVGGVAGALISDGVYVEIAGPRTPFAAKFLPRFTTLFSTNETGIANALYSECGINMDQVHEVFVEMDNGYSTDADDVAMLYLGRVFAGGGNVKHALSLHKGLRKLLTDILESGAVFASERQMAARIRGL